MPEPKKAGRPRKTANESQKATPKEAFVEAHPHDSAQATPSVIYVETNQGPKLKQHRNKIPNDYIIGIRSGVQGILTFTSSKTHCNLRIDQYGGTDTLTYEDLVSMKNSQLRFFTDNWIFIEDTDDFTAEEIYKALGVERYYKDILEIDDVDSVLAMRPDALQDRIKNMPKGVAQSIVTRARKLMLDGSDIMDSNKKIKIIEDTFNVELIPKDI